MNCTLELTDLEWELIYDLLERERRELRPEIRHSGTASVRDDLRRRLEMVQGLLGKIPQHIGG
ncbi:MAG: hypothetical protein BIFFINMI_03713 [Phycisphaerae bacterium]|nr:hypothetical protein [Phycisphaerae bacterium]